VKELSIVMDTMKDRSRITKEMDKVCNSFFLLYGLFIILCFIGEYFGNNGIRYEG